MSYSEWLRRRCKLRRMNHDPADPVGSPPALTCLLAASVVLAGCAITSAPTEQMAVARAALAHAAGAQGNELAPAEMRLARDKLDRAQLALAERYYHHARQLAEEAQADAELAEAKAHALKANRAADELREANRALAEEMERKSP